MVANTFTWTVSTGGNSDWETPANWDLNSGFPGSNNTDVAVLNGAFGSSYTVTVSASDTPSLASVTLSSAFANLEVDGILTTGSLSDINAVVSVVNAGTLSISRRQPLTIGASGSGTVAIIGVGSRN